MDISKRFLYFILLSRSLALCRPCFRSARKKTASYGAVFLYAPACRQRFIPLRITGSSPYSVTDTITTADPMTAVSPILSP